MTNNHQQCQLQIIACRHSICKWFPSFLPRLETGLQPDQTRFLPTIQKTVFRVAESGTTGNSFKIMGISNHGPWCLQGDTQPNRSLSAVWLLKDGFHIFFFLGISPGLQHPSTGLTASRLAEVPLSDLRGAQHLLQVVDPANAHLHHRNLMIQRYGSTMFEIFILCLILLLNQPENLIRWCQQRLKKTHTPRSIHSISPVPTLGASSPRRSCAARRTHLEGLQFKLLRLLSVTCIHLWGVGSWMILPKLRLHFVKIFVWPYAWSMTYNFPEQM